MSKQPKNCRTSTNHPNTNCSNTHRRCLKAFFTGILGMGLLATTANSTLRAQDVPQGFRRVVLNPLDRPDFPGIAGWKVSQISASSINDPQPKLGGSIVRITGHVDSSGGKVDAPAFDGTLDNPQSISAWVRPVENSNVATFGFQIIDAEGEQFMQLVPVDWTGWKQVQIGPTSGQMKQAWNQKDKNKTVDLPLKSVHLVFFAKQAGNVAIDVDGLTAIVKASPDQTGVKMSPITSQVIDAGQPLNLRPIIENLGDTDQTVKVDYSFQVNSAYLDPVRPDPTLGYDHALGAKSTVTVNDEDKGDAKVTDGDENTAYETPWGGKYKEAAITIDLGTSRNITAVHWRAGDANWIFLADLSTSTDGNTFKPVAEAQNFDMHHKWSANNAFPWPKSVQARYLRFRFHKANDEISPKFSLPSTIMVYDGIANDDIQIPKTGEVLFTGSAQTLIPPRDFAELKITADQQLTAGSYLLGLTTQIDGQTQKSWSHIFVAPTDTVPAENTRRFGINSSEIKYAQSMRKVGFGWVRFENAKWIMFMPGPDQYAFDGSVKPWVVNHDKINATYAALDMDVLPYIVMTPEWETSAPADVKQNRRSYPPKDLTKYGEAIFQYVARYAGNKVDPSLLKTTDKKTGLNEIQAVELWNEPNLNAPSWGPFVGTMAQYFEMMRAGVEGSRKADPKLPISAAGYAGIDLTVIGQLAEYHYADGKTPLDLVDIVNGHFYSGRQDPEVSGWDPNVDRNGPSDSGTTYPEQLADLVAWKNLHKPSAQVWITETGNDVGGPIGLGEREQAAKLPRVTMLALAAGIDKVFIYREAGSTPTRHAGAGLLRNDGSMRPSWVTVATMIRQLQGFNGPALRLPTTDNNTWMFLWQDDNRRILTAWTLGESRPLDINLGKAAVVDAFGHPSDVTSTANVQISYFPVYITLQEDTPQLTNLIQQATAAQKQRDERRTRLSQLPAYLYDFGSDQYVGMLKGFGLPRRFTPVDKDATWNADKGYGLSSAAPSQGDMHWINSALDRDSIRMVPTNTFSIRMHPGEYTLRISIGGGNTTPQAEVTVKSDGRTQTAMTTGSERVAELKIKAGSDPVSVSLSKTGDLRWITAIPADAK